MVRAAQRNPRRRTTVLHVTLAVAGWLAIAAATLTPTSGDTSAPAFGCVICGPDGGIDAGLGELEGGPQARAAGSDDDRVVVDPHVSPSRPARRRSAR